MGKIRKYNTEIGV